jgi:hypothetical protein
MVDSIAHRFVATGTIVAVAAGSPRYRPLSRDGEIEGRIMVPFNGIAEMSGGTQSFHRRIR